MEVKLGQTRTKMRISYQMGKLIKSVAFLKNFEHFALVGRRLRQTVIHQLPFLARKWILEKSVGHQSKFLLGFQTLVPSKFKTKVLQDFWTSWDQFITGRILWIDWFIVKLCLYGLFTTIMGLNTSFITLMWHFELIIFQKYYFHRTGLYSYMTLQMSGLSDALVSSHWRKSWQKGYLKYLTSGNYLVTPMIKWFSGS